MRKIKNLNINEIGFEKTLYTILYKRNAGESAKIKVNKY